MLLDARTVEHDAEKTRAAVPDAFDGRPYGLSRHHLGPDYDDHAISQRTENERFGHRPDRWRVDDDP